MTKQREGFRERFAEVGGGFKVEKPKAVTMPVLKTDTNIDLSKLEKFTDSRAETKGVAEKIRPQGMDGIQLDTNLDKLNESLEKVKRQQINDKIRTLVEEAERLMDREQYKPAVNVLDKALSIVATSVQALFLKGFCLYNLGQYKPAIEVLDEARLNSDDPDMIVSIMILQANCQRALTQLLEDRIFELMDRKQYVKALEFIEQELKRDPTHTALLYYRCLNLMELTRFSEAKNQANAAMKVVYQENISLFEEVITRILFREYEKPLQAARKALRNGDAVQALGELQACQSGLSGKESYEAMRAYAEEKKGRGGFFQSLFARKNQTPPMTEDARQLALGWLLSEEIEAGLALISVRDYKSAIHYFEEAAKIDANCSLICLFHGSSIFNNFRDSLERQEDIGNIDDAIKNLEKGASLLRRAASDPATAEQSELFIKLIHNDIEDLKGIKRQIDQQIAEMKPVNDIIHEYNALMDKLDKSPLDTAKNINWFTNQFETLEKKAQKVMKTCSQDNLEFLTQLVVAIGSNLNFLDQMRNELPITGLIKEFNALMGRLNQGAIGSPSDIERYESQFRNIKQRTETFLLSDTSDQAKDILRQVLTSVNDNLSELNKLRNSSVLLVNECVNEFTTFMDGLERNKIGNRAQLRAARNRAAALKLKVAKARGAILAEHNVTDTSSLGSLGSLFGDASNQALFNDFGVPASVKNSEGWKIIKDLEMATANLQSQLSQINEWQFPY